MSKPGPNIGIVLGGGGIAGYAFHCAALAALEAATGFDPRTAEIIIGTSAGAIAAALLRGNVPATQARDGLRAGAENPDEMPTLRLLAGPTPKAMPRVWTGPGAPTMAIREIRRGRGLQMSKLLASLLPRGRSDLRPIGEPIGELHKTGWPERPLWIPATDLRSGRLVVFGRGDAPSASVAKAVEASAALPLFFAPARIGTRQYIDGGISSPFNADLLVDYRSADGRAPLDLVVVMAPLSMDELNRRTPVSSAARSLPRRRLKQEIRKIEAAGTPTLVLQPGRVVATAMGLNPMDHGRVPAIMDRADEQVVQQLRSVSATTLDLFGRAAKVLESPQDVAYPLL